MGVQSSEWELPHHNEKFIAIIFRTLNAVCVWTLECNFQIRRWIFNGHLVFKNFIAYDYWWKLSAWREIIVCNYSKSRDVVECDVPSWKCGFHYLHHHVPECEKLSSPYSFIVWLPSALLNDQSHIHCI